jgi:hypothetical protein
MFTFVSLLLDVVWFLELEIETDLININEFMFVFLFGVFQPRSN